PWCCGNSRRRSAGCKQRSHHEAWPIRPALVTGAPESRHPRSNSRAKRTGPMNIMTHGAAPANITEIAENTSAACISSRVRQLSRIIPRVYDDAMRPLGITVSQFTLLTQIAQQDGITAVDIGHTLDIEKSTLSRNLKRLLKDGHITMDPPAGRRGRGLHLTPKGAQVIQLGYPVWREAQSRTINVMGPESRSTLDAFLTQAERLAAA